MIFAIRFRIRRFYWHRIKRTMMPEEIDAYWCDMAQAWAKGELES